MAISIDKLTDEVMKELDEYADVCEETLIEVTNSISKEAVAQLKTSSPRRKRGGGAYAKSWSQKNDPDYRGSKKYGKVVYNKEHYRLTHLLEYGHPIVKNGKEVGSAKEFPHIEKVEQWVISEYERRLKGKL